MESEGKLKEIAREIDSQKGWRATKRVKRWKKKNLKGFNLLVDRFNENHSLLERLLTTKRKKVQSIYYKEKGTNGFLSRLLLNPFVYASGIVLASGFALQSSLDYSMVKHPHDQVVESLKASRSKEELENTRFRFKEDREELTSEGATCLTRDKSGNCSVESVPTLNQFLPDRYTPEGIANFFDQTMWRTPFWQLPFIYKERIFLLKGTNTVLERKFQKVIN